MILPYKVKNPGKTFPTCTLLLIIANTLVFAATGNFTLHVTREAVAAFAYVPGHSPAYTIFTSLFLHLHIFHLFFNMFFLWIFSRPVEDRMGGILFLLIYFTTGIMGGILWGIIDNALIGSPIPTIGASGAVMGIMGAYVYMFPWSKVCVMYYFLPIKPFRGIAEITAFWVIGFYFLGDLFWGTVYGIAQERNGIANFAHLFGMLTGLILAKLLGAKRDSQAMSEAKAAMSGAYDFSGLNLWQMMPVLEKDPSNPEVLGAFIEKSLLENKRYLIEDALKAAGPSLIIKGPELVASYLLERQGDIRIYSPAQIFTLAGVTRRAGKIEEALKLYQTALENFPDDPALEMGYLKLAEMEWNHLKDAESALGCLDEMQRRFPEGKLASYALDLRDRIRMSSPV